MPSILGRESPCQQLKREHLFMVMTRMLKTGSYFSVGFPEQCQQVLVGDSSTSNSQRVRKRTLIKWNDAKNKNGVP